MAEDAGRRGKESKQDYRHCQIRKEVADELVRVYKENPWLGAPIFGTIMNLAAVEHLENVYDVVNRRKKALADAKENGIERQAEA